MTRTTPQQAQDPPGETQPQRLEPGLTRYVIPYAVTLVPALLMMLSWSPGAELSRLELALRNSGGPVIAAELFAILIAVKEGMLKSLPRWDWSRPVIAAIAVLVAVSVTTALLAPVRAIAIVVTAHWFIHAFFGLAIAYLSGRLFTAKDMVRAYLVGFAAVAALFILAILQIPDWSSFAWQFDLPGFNHVRHAGIFFGLLAALAIGVLAVARNRAEWVWAFATASLGVGLSLWTGSRGGLLAIVGALAVSLLLVPAMRTPRAWGGAVASLLLAMAVVSQVPTPPHHMLGAARAVEASVSERATTGRTQMWGIILAAAKERPVFGYGEGQMREVAPFARVVQPHNSIMQVLLAWGIVGLLCVLVLAVAFARRAIAAVRSNDGYIVPAFVGLSAAAILSLVDNALDPMPGSMFAAFAGILASRWSSSHARAAT